MKQQPFHTFETVSGGQAVTPVTPIYIGTVSDVTPVTNVETVICLRVTTAKHVETL